MLRSLTVVSRGSQNDGASPSEPAGATEPITLTDPDGAVTRVAPWSSWIREQVRAPGGEPALITRLDQGQLWFSAGRRRSPWRHEVHVGPAVISTPRGRFHAVAEPDGGATVACLAGRTRVVSGLWAPVLLSPDQTAAISADGRTLVVMDQTTESVIEEEQVVIDLTAEEAGAVGEHDESPSSDQDGIDGELAVLAAARARIGEHGASDLPVAGRAGLPPAPAIAATPSRAEAADDRRPARLGWIPELVAVAAMLALLVAAIWVFTTEADATDTTTPVTTTTEAATTTEAPTTTDPPTTTEPRTTTAAPTTTVAPTTTPARRPASTSAAIGTLEGCARRGSVVEATVLVRHQSGSASAFEVTAAMVDETGVASATGRATTAVIDPGGSAPVTVSIDSSGPLGGACQLVQVRGV